MTAVGNPALKTLATIAAVLLIVIAWCSCWHSGRSCTWHALRGDEGLMVTLLWPDPRTWRSRILISAHRRARELRPYDALLRSSHRRARFRHRDGLPPATDARLERELRAYGVAQRPFASFGSPIEATVEAADRICSVLSQLPSEDSIFHDEVGDALLSEPELYLWGLSDPVLDFVERYLGLPVGGIGVSVKREIANGRMEGPGRVFHRDPEDERVLKIIVYLSDVDEGAGPFQCLDAVASDELMLSGRRQRYLAVPGVSEIERVVPRGDWVTCLGPRLTANIVDTARCVHRASPPTTTDRYSITYSYVSNRPYLVYESNAVVQAAFVQRWSSRLTQRQRDVLGT